MVPSWDYVAVGVIAALATWLATFAVRKVAVEAQLVVVPSERRIHERPTPTAGGAAMLVAFLMAMVVASALPGLHDLFVGSSEPLGAVLAVGVIFAVGFYDDIREMSPPAKIAGQVLAASVLYFLGITMFQLKVPFGGEVVLSADVTPLVGAIWVVGITNAVNLIDGLDGLAAGIVAIAAGALCIYGIRLEHLGVLPGSDVGPLLAAIACGVSVGFLPHNFHPAKIFMGDAGALMLGLLMAASTMVIGGRTPDVSGETYFFFAPLFIPFFILGVPILDMAFAIVRRTVRRSGLSTPDKDHLHHRLLRLGHGQRRSVLILWAWTAILSGVALYPTFDPSGNAWIPFGAAALVVVLYTFFMPGRRPSGGPDGAVLQEDSAKCQDIGRVETRRVLRRAR